MSHHSAEEIEAIQNVVDRVGSYQDGATEGTVEHELRQGFSEAELDIDDQAVRQLVAAIEEQHANVDVASVLAAD